MGNLLTKAMGNVLTMLVGKVLTTVMGKVLDIYNMIPLYAVFHYLASRQTPHHLRKKSSQIPLHPRI